MSLAHPGDLGDADGHSVEVSKELRPHEIRISCTDPGLTRKSRTHTQCSDANADWNEGLTMVHLLVVCEASLVEDLAKRCQHLQIRTTPGQFLNAMQERIPDGVRCVLDTRVVLSEEIQGCVVRYPQPSPVQGYGGLRARGGQSVVQTIHIRANLIVNLRAKRATRRLSGRQRGHCFTLRNEEGQHNGQARSDGFWRLHGTMVLDVHLRQHENNFRVVISRP
mmetsp:Transcript_63980/g.169372  ORF Transcript_63980/g.169372 Transcript_63980/m.169372 type:complete len:222 (+) Transcript_63980:541-1206(+)